MIDFKYNPSMDGFGEFAKYTGAINLGAFSMMLKRWGFNVGTRVRSDAGHITINWNDFVQTKNSPGLRDMLTSPVLECDIFGDTINNIRFMRPCIIQKERFLQYVYATVMRDNNEPVGSWKWSDTLDEAVDDLNVLDRFFKEAIFLVKWSIDLLNSKLLSDAREELWRLPKEDEAAFFHTKFKKIENMFLILLDETRITFADEDLSWQTASSQLKK